MKAKFTLFSYLKKCISVKKISIHFPFIAFFVKLYISPDVCLSCSYLSWCAKDLQNVNRRRKPCAPATFFLVVSALADAWQFGVYAVPPSLFTFIWTAVKFYSLYHTSVTTPRAEAHRARTRSPRWMFKEEVNHEVHCVICFNFTYSARYVMCMYTTVCDDS